MMGVFRDIRFAARGLIAQPGFTITAVVTLALAVGVNAVMLDVLDRLLVRDPPGVRDPRQVSDLFWIRRGFCLSQDQLRELCRLQERSERLPRRDRDIQTRKAEPRAWTDGASGHRHELQSRVLRRSRSRPVARRSSRSQREGSGRGRRNQSRAVAAAFWRRA
jgi:hypothetical protein